jgi:hypothetical protein
LYDVREQADLGLGEYTQCIIHSEHTIGFILFYE